MSNSLWAHGLYSPQDSPGQNSEVGNLSFLQEIFPTQEFNPDFPHCRWILYQLSHKGSLRILEWVAYPFSSRSSWPRNWTRVSWTADRFFTNWAMREGPCMGNTANILSYKWNIIFKIANHYVAHPKHILIPHQLHLNLKIKILKSHKKNSKI